METVLLICVWLLHLSLLEYISLVDSFGIKLRTVTVEDEVQVFPEYQAVVGGRAELPCNITQPSHEDKVSLILWYKEDSRAPIYSVDARNTPVEKAKHFPGTTLGSRAFFETIHKPTVLRIEPVLEKDAGIYRCRVDYRWARTHITNLILSVVVPPKEIMVLDEDDQELAGIIGPYDEGKDLRLKCESLGGVPPPSVSWWRGLTQLDDSFDVLSEGIVRNELVLKELQRTDLMTILTCQANNNNVTLPISTSVKLDMNLKPVYVRITSVKRTFSSGRRAELVCQSSGSRPPSRISWWMGADQLVNTTERISSNGNMTTSVLSFWPSGDDYGKYLACKADNPRLKESTVEDGWIMNVSYIPKVAISLRTYPKQQQSISEGNDVYFLCDIRANPGVIEIGWKFEGRPLMHNPGQGIVINNQSLVVKKVQRENRGRYQCWAANIEGKGESEMIYLRINYTPVCRPGQKIVYGVAKEEAARVECEVDSEPAEASFRWMFNNSVDQHNILSFTSEGVHSIATYIPRTLSDFGTLFCWAKNIVGEQQVPCVFTVIPAGPPDPLKNCTVTNSTMDTITVECEAGYDGGLQQRFHLELYNSDQEYLQANLTSRRTTSFQIDELPSGTDYIVVIYASNIKGRSSSVVIKGQTIKDPRKESASISESVNIILGVMIGIVAALVFIAGIAVFIIRLRADNNQAGGREESAREKEEILLKKNLVDPGEQDGKDPDVIPSQNIYCCKMDQNVILPNMVYPRNVDYISEQDEVQFRVEREPPNHKRNPLYDPNFTGSLERAIQHRKQYYEEYCSAQPSPDPSMAQYESSVPFTNLDQMRRSDLPLSSVADEDEERSLYNHSPTSNSTFHCNKDTYTPPRGKRTFTTPV